MADEKDGHGLELVKDLIIYEGIAIETSRYPKHKVFVYSTQKGWDSSTDLSADQECGLVAPPAQSKAINPQFQSAEKSHPFSK